MEAKTLLDNWLRPLLVAEARVEDGSVILTLCGDLDLPVTSVLSEQIAKALPRSPERLVFDMSRVEFIDCAAVGVILRAQRYLPDGQRPVLRHAGPAVRRLLALAGLDGQCVVEP